MPAINTAGADLMSHKNRNVRCVSGRCAGGAAVVSRVDGAGFSVARSGVGVYVLTFDAYQKFLGGSAIIMSAAADLVARITAYSVASKTITITVLARNGVATPTDLAAADELWFAFNFGWSQRS